MVDSKKVPPLPAPTETDTATPSELATDISRPGDDKSTYSLPEDGTPVTIKTRGHKANRSQTSLLIEYFEGGKVSASGSGTEERKPSVRVRLTPSKKGKGDHFQVTETKGSRKVSMTRRIPVDASSGPHDLDLPEGEDAHSMTSYASATEESNVSRNPIDIEIERGHRRRRPASPLIPSEERIAYMPGNPSEISAIPTDSFLDGTGPSGDVRDSTTRSKGDALAGAAIGAAAGAVAHEALRSSKTRSNERARVADKSKKESSDKKKRSSKSRTSSGEYASEDVRSPRRRSSRSHQESNVSGVPDSSFVSTNPSATSQRSLDVRSVRSSASKASSINNPKLLETVEDAIRRLILPELSALKREQSKREGRRSSITSTGTGASREEGYSERRRSSSHRADSSKDSPRRERRNREARHEYDDDSLRSISRDSLGDDYTTASPRRSEGLLKAAAAGAVGLAAARGISSAMDGQDTSDRKHRERRRRRAESSRSSGLGEYGTEFDAADDPAPPMPLMSDINPSEVTRTSILSADTDRPHSAEEEILSRDMPEAIAAPISHLTATKPPIDFLPPMSTQHANVSQGDLTALPRGQDKFAEEYETDEFGRKVPMSHDNYYSQENSREPEYNDYPEDSYYNSYHTFQDVPPPLKYVPYQAGARGLSPIPSVSGYTEAGSEAPLPQRARSMQSTGDVMSSPGKSPNPQHEPRSMQSIDSIQLTPDMHKPSQQGEEYFPETAAGQQVRGGANSNPNIIHPPFGVESAVASLVDGSMLEQSVVTGASGHEYHGAARDSFISAEDAARMDSRGVSPDKMSIDSRRDFLEDTRGTPEARSIAQSHEFSEYELDENGRKVAKTRQRQSPTASEAAITLGAVGAAAAAIKAAQMRQQAVAEGRAVESDFQPAGVARNRSFKERAREWKPRTTPTPSMDEMDYEEQPKMSASAVPDLNDPTPMFGYRDDDDLVTNPSVVGERLDGHAKEVDWEEHSGRITPTPKGYAEETYDKSGLGITAAAGAAALGAAAGMAAHAARHDNIDDANDWRRTSEDRKRDTIITNPYEDTSPAQNPTLDDQFLERQLDDAYGAPYTGSPGMPHKYDEGYISNAANATPEPIARDKVADIGDLDRGLAAEDPFYTSKENPRHLSGLSQGVASPFYDAAMGGGMDRIENQDIVALMQHLMVRDAQRSARDTEIVALLMNAALEMKNSFREMKELVQDTSDDVIFANVENTEKMEKAIQGAKPYPSTAARSLQSGSQAGTGEEVVKKKNLWKRALQGLSNKGTNDLTRIEDMLVQLLGEVNDLKAQNGQGPVRSIRAQSAEPLTGQDDRDQDSLDYDLDDAGTVRYTAQSGPPTARGTATRTFSDHRISTVPEHEEEYQYEDGQRTPKPTIAAKELLSPTYADEAPRGGSAPLDSPSHPGSGSNGGAAISADNTPKSEKGKKHKSSSSSAWFPKISRWSETTASSVGKAFRGSGTSKKGGKYEDYLPPSRSGSSLASYEDGYRHDPYGEDKLHTGFSNPSLIHEKLPQDIPHPTIPAFAILEDPKYKAHRNSVNLQHPQPRSGQTERHRTALEYSAQEYDSPQTPRSADWAGSATSLSRLPPNTNRYSTTSSAAARETDYALGSAQDAPPRPPKEPIESPHTQTPQKSVRISQLQKDSPAAHMSYESGYGSGTGTQVSHFTDRSPKFENRNLSTARGMPARRPSGPRAMTPKSPEDEAAREERRRKRDTFGTVASQDTDTF